MCSHARADNYILLCLYKYMGWRNKHEAHYPNDCSLQTYIPVETAATAIGARQEHLCKNKSADLRRFCLPSPRLRRFFFIYFIIIIERTIFFLAVNYNYVYCTRLFTPV